MFRDPVLARIIEPTSIDSARVLGEVGVDGASSADPRNALGEARGSNAIARHLPVHRGSPPTSTGGGVGIAGRQRKRRIMTIAPRRCLICWVEISPRRPGAIQLARRKRIC